MAKSVITSWSFSALSMFENCPRKYWAVKIGKVVSDSNQFNRLGDDEHSSIEYFFKHNHALPPALAGMTPVFQAIKDAPGERYVEYKMTIRKDFSVTTGRDWDHAWLRGAGDLVLVSGNVARYFDWKSGKPRTDVEDQIDITSLLLFRHFPNVEEVRGAMLYYRHNKMTPHTTYKRDESRLWNHYIGRVRELETAIQTGNFPENPNPLCGWCPYMACPHNKTKEREAREAAKNAQPS